MATTVGDYNLPIIEATDKISAPTLGDQLRDDINALANSTSVALGQANPFKRNLTASESMNDLTTPGFYRVLSQATADALGLPRDSVTGGAAEVEVKPVGVAVVQEIKYLAPVSENWQREKYANGTVWGEYRRTDFHNFALMPGTTAGYKLTAQSFTTGFGGGTTTGSGFMRYLATLTPFAGRGRICVANVNPRFLGTHGAAVNLTAVTLAVAGANGAQSTVTTVETGATTGTAGYRSPVVDFAAYAGKDIQIGLDYSSGGTIQQNYGTGFGGSGTGAAGTGAATKQTTLPLFVWIEFEVPWWVPTYAAKGDSLAIAVGATNPLYDSPISQLARRTGGVPMHWAHSGDSLANWPRGSAKWNLYGKNVAPADAVILSDGSNDVFGGATVSDLQNRFLANAEIARQKISPNIYATTIAPRTAITGTMEDTRRAYNAWLKSGAAPIRGVYDFAAAISSDDETIIPAFDADGIHYKTAGYTAQTDLLVAVPPVPVNPNVALDARLTSLETSRVTVDNSVGRAVFAWDAANNRAQMIAYDSGVRDISALVPDRTNTGTVLIHRTNNSVVVYIDAMAVAAGATFTYAGLIPAGFRPAATVHDTTLNLVAGTDQYRISVSTAGNVSLYSYVTGKLLRATLSYSTNNARPVTLPGTEVGSL